MAPRTSRGGVAANGADDRVEVRVATQWSCTRDGAALLLVAELMDNGGLGEGMLPLAAAAARGGLLVPGAQIVPKRLRIFCTLVELRGCGDAHDGAELTPSSLCGVSLAPWLAYRTRRSYAAVDLAPPSIAPPSRSGYSSRLSLARRRPTVEPSPCRSTPTAR